MPRRFRIAYAFILLVELPARAALEATPREILASGDAVEGFGRIGFGSFTGYGLDDRGRALVHGALSDGSDGLFWVDGSGATALWRRAVAAWGTTGFDNVLVSGSGRVIGWQSEEAGGSGLYEITPRGLTPLVRSGDVTEEGDVLCRVWRPVIGDADMLAFTGFTDSEPLRCGSGPLSVFVFDRGVVRRVIGQHDLPPVDGELLEEIELLGVSAAGTVALQLGYSGRMLAVSPDGSQRAVNPGDLLPSGQRFAGVAGRGISSTGELLFSAVVEGRTALYRTAGTRVVEVVADGDRLGPGETINGVGRGAHMNARGDVVASVTSPGRLPGVDDPIPTQAYVFAAASGERRIIRVEGTLFGLNAGGDVALQPFEPPARIVRWRAGEMRTLIAAQDPGPDGTRFAIGGVQGPHCLAADGRAGSVVYDAAYRQGLVCADAVGASTVVRQGDPSPDGGELLSLSECTMTGDGEILFAAPRLIREQDRYENDSVYRAGAAGIERVVGPGVESGGIVVHDLSQWGVGFAGDAFAANDAGTVLAWANTEDGNQLLRRRRGGPLEAVRFHFDDPLMRSVFAIDWAGIAADDTVVANALIDRAGGGLRMLLASDGQQARIIAEALDPNLPSGPLLRFDELLVRGDHVLIVAYGVDERHHALAFSLADGGVRELLEPWADGELASPYVVRDLTQAPALLFDVVAPSDAFERFQLVGSEIERVFPAAADPTDLPVAINDRGNVLSTLFDTHAERSNHSMRLRGPAPEPAARCVVPPTAIPRTLPPSTPTPTPVDCNPIGPGCLHLEIGSASGRPGETVSIDVRLFTGASKVAGTQNDLVFVAEAPFDALPSGRPACRVNPAIYKNGTASNFLPVGCQPGIDCERLRVLVLALDSVDPIPDGSLLYTCDLTIAAGAPPGRYPIAAVEVGYSDPKGMALIGALQPGSVEVLASGDAGVVSGGGGSDGCAVGESELGLWPLVLVAWLVRRAARKGLLD